MTAQFSNPQSHQKLLKAENFQNAIQASKRTLKKDSVYIQAL